MENDARLTVCSAMVEADRRWIVAMDSKAAFICALNTLLLAFVWTGAKLGDLPQSSAMNCVYASTALAFMSLWKAVRVILPRGVLHAALKTKDITYTAGYKPFSFYGFVASRYSAEDFDQFFKDLMALDTTDYIREAIEQHFTISRIVQQKSDGVEFAGWLWLLAMIAAVAALALKAGT